MFACVVNVSSPSVKYAYLTIEAIRARSRWQPSAREPYRCRFASSSRFAVAFVAELVDDLSRVNSSLFLSLSLSLPLPRRLFLAVAIACSSTTGRLSVCRAIGWQRAGAPASIRPTNRAQPDHHRWARRGRRMTPPGWSRDLSSLINTVQVTTENILHLSLFRPILSSSSSSLHLYLGWRMGQHFEAFAWVQ